MFEVIAAKLEAGIGQIRRRFRRPVYQFPPALLEADGSVVAKIRAMLLATNPQGFAGSYAAVRDMDMRRTIALIACPTLVIAGQYDAVTLPSHSELIAATVPGTINSRL